MNIACFVFRIPCPDSGAIVGGWSPLRKEFLRFPVEKLPSLLGIVEGKSGLLLSATTGLGGVCARGKSIGQEVVMGVTNARKI
jgi:hypothetical protein